MYKVLIVGLGKIGMGYDLHLGEELILTHAKAFSLHSNFELVGGIDSSEQARSCFKKRYGCEAFASLEAASHIQPDIVVVAIPTNDHLVCIEETFKYFRPKAILCEKPLAYRLDAAQSIIDLCALYSCQLFVNYIRRSQPNNIEIIRRIQKKQIQTPIRGVVWYSKGLIHTASHFINLLSFWLGQVEVVKLINVVRHLEFNDIEADININFQLGSVMFMALDERNYTHYSMQLYACNGRLNYCLGGERVIWQPTKMDTKLEGYTFLSEAKQEFPAEMDKSQWHVVDQLGKFLESGEALISTGIDAFEVVKVVNEVVMEAHRTKYE